MFLPSLNYVTVNVKDRFKSHEIWIVFFVKITPTKRINSNAQDGTQLAEFCDGLLRAPATVFSEFCLDEKNG